MREPIATEAEMKQSSKIFHSPPCNPSEDMLYYVASSGHKVCSKGD